MDYKDDEKEEDFNDDDDDDRGYNDPSSWEDYTPRSRAPKRPTAASLEPDPITVPVGTPVELWDSSKLVFGVYEGKNPGKASVRIRIVETGEVVSLDVGQIVGIWHHHHGLPDNKPPIMNWQGLQEEADKLLKGLPARRLNLDKFWEASVVQWKRDKQGTDSYQLAGYLFHSGAFDKAAKMRMPYSGQVTPAERYAAATVLASESFHFKRQSAKLADVQMDEEEAVMLLGGGYRPLDSSVVQSREVMSFCQAVRAREGGQQSEGAKKGAGSTWDAVQWRMLHSLEVLALGGGVETISTNARHALKELEEDVSPDGAKNVLIRAGYWTTDKRAGKGPQSAEATAREDQGGNKEEANEEALSRKAELASPWPEDILELAKQTLATATRRRQSYDKVAIPERVGRRGPHGRHDYRRAPFKFYCVDPAGSEFSDDALSYDPETGEVLINIADIQSVVGTSANPTLHDVARQRGEALYLPDGPLHLLPPPALQAASLSDRYPNECVTVAVRLNDKGWVESSRVMLTLIPPVIRLTYNTVNDFMSAEEGAIQPYHKQAAQELRVIMDASERRRAFTQRSFSDSKVVSRVTRNKEGELEAISFQRSPAHLMVDELLALYTEAARYLCGTKGVTLPLSAGTVRAKQDAPRFATGPLRRYVDILAQGQIVAVLKGIKPLSKKDIVEKMTLVNWQKSTSQRLRNTSKNRALLEAFASFCAAQTRRTKKAYVTVSAICTGTGTEVFLPDAGLTSHITMDSKAPRSGLFLQPDEKVLVDVLDVDPLKGVIRLRFHDKEDERRAVEGSMGKGQDEEIGA